MIEVRRLGHATLTTPDLDRQVAYYTEIVGLTLLERDSKRALLASKQGFEAVALEPGPPNALSRLAFQVAPGSDLAVLARELAKHGVKSERRSGISPGVADALVFKDPKDTWIEVFSDYVFAPEDPAQAGIMPLKLGHVAYRVNDVQHVVKFYTDVLGFRVSDWHGDTFAFLRCGPDHHTVNFVFDEVPQLHHIAFEVKDWAEGRGARLFRSAPMAPGPAAAAEGMGAGHAAELLGLRVGAHHSRLPDGGVGRSRSCGRGAQTA
jgi:catechol-2,3-dioxygenase